MGSLGPGRKRRLLRLLALSALVVGAPVASAAGPGGWDHLGDRGSPGTDSLDLAASALVVTPGALYVGGEFTDAGGIADADRIATWTAAACASPKTYKKLKPGKHVFRVKARDRAGNLDATPAVKRFKIKKRSPARAS